MKRFDLTRNFRLLGKRFQLFGFGLKIIICEIVTNSQMHYPMRNSLETVSSRIQ